MSRPVPSLVSLPNTRKGTCWVGAVTWLSALLLALACASSDDPPTGPSLPRPDLGPMEPSVRRQIEEQIALVDSLVSGGEAEPRELGTAAGELGRLYHAYGLEEAAAKCYREAERLDPEAARWPYLLGFLLQVRRENGAAEAFERARRLDPDNPATLLRLARARFDAGEIEAAEALFRQSLENHPPSAAAARAGLGEIAAARAGHAAAVEHYAAALALQPSATRLHYPLGLAYKELGETAKAAEHLRLRGDTPVAFPDPLAAALDRQAAGSALHVNRAGIALAEDRYEEAVAEYRLAVAADPDNATARSELGMLLAAGGDLEGSRAELQAARELEPGNPAHLESLARVLEAASSGEEALGLFREAVDLEPARAAGHLQLAAALARAGRATEAQASFDRALELDPAGARARLGRAEVLLELGQPEAAVEDLEAALRAEPANARASLRLGEALQTLRRPAAARAAFEAALAGTLQPHERAAALLGAANLGLAGGDLEGAIARYREVLEIAPGLVQAQINLAGALAKAGRTEEAIRRYDELLADQPDHALARTYRAELLLDGGRVEEALDGFDEALARNPALARAHLGLALALQALGRWQEARSRLEGSLAALPRDPRPANALARLLASSPEPAVRDGERAVQLAMALISADRSPAHAETLAMALAATGRYEEASQWQRELLSQARAGGAPGATLARLEAHLALYESGSPCCSLPGPG